ncbi:MAG: DsbC family protein [Gammaproteobacteria bacterium SHHR-1]|uniref:DsbC family protein n=1 Tax=Magnetovirga frankeli TaxID=947516 RepID=UPI001292EA0B|nr:DsbC family protein [gamma proteobacterium SS-5]
MQIKNIALSLAASLLLAQPLLAETDGKGAVQQRLAKMMPGAKPDSISESPVKGLYEVVFGPQVVYLSADGRYFMKANIIDLETDENLTEKRRSSAIQGALAEVGEDNMIIFGDTSKHQVTVFTDIDCGYCRKLHKEIAAYNKADIQIRYLFYPRAGVGSPSYDKAVSVWCADDQKKAMTQAKDGKKVAEKKCDNPVVEHMRLGELMGINGTPAMILPDGELLPGYVPAAKLSQYLEGK